MILLPSDWVLPALQRMLPGLWLPFYEQGDMLLQCVEEEFETLFRAIFRVWLIVLNLSESIQPPFESVF